MIGEHSILAIIPARAGSKRLPGKNVREFGGKPMVAWSIEEAKKSRYIDTVVVSTDDMEVKAIAKDYGVQICDRPPELAADESSIYDGIFQALQFFEPHDFLCLLQVTSPLRIREDIDASIEECIRHNAPACITVSDHRPDANGAVYIAWTSWLRETRLFDTGRVVVHTMPKARSVDIDHLEDFQEAERLLSLRRSQES